MRASYLGHHRRNLTITTIISIFAVVAIVMSAFAIFGVKDNSPQSVVIGSKIDKSLGGGAQASKC